MDTWQQVKLHYIGLLTNHHQPELAETFFNSVTTKILHRSYFNNDFIFVRPAVSTEYIENDEPAACPPTAPTTPPSDEPARHAAAHRRQLPAAARVRGPGARHRPVLDAVQRRWAMCGCAPTSRSRCSARPSSATRAPTWSARSSTASRDAVRAAHPAQRQPASWYIDAALFGEDDLLMLFSFARAYFMVDMEVPSRPTCSSCAALMPRKPRRALQRLGLQKQGKNLFYRDFLYHLRHSSDKFRIAPGIKGMVMLVFDLPSFPYVFKVIKDFYPPQKDTTREQIKGKYLLVKQHDRVGRMADTLEYSNVAFPRSRFEDELIAELKHFCPSLLEDRDGDGAGHQARLHRAAHDPAEHLPAGGHAGEQMEHAVIEYGNAIKDLVAANIFPGDMLWKNFGVTRHGKVVFYDYDEIEYITDCNFRRVPTPRNEEEEMSGEIWYGRPATTCSPRPSAPSCWATHAVREVFMKHHADLLDAAFWQGHKQRIRRPRARRVPLRQRFCHQPLLAPPGDPARPETAQPAQPFSEPTQKEPLMSDSIVIVSAARTPIGGLLGDFANLPAWELGAVAIQGRRRARRRARRRRRRGADGQLPDGRPGPGAGAPGGAQGRPAATRPAP
jgi:isocitrate dehydrogenase kinase/phosphatase